MAVPKVLLWDVETSFIKLETYQWSLHPGEVHFPYSQVVQDWFIICAAWQWVGQRKIHSVSVLDDLKRFKKAHYDDYHVVKTLHDVLSQADAIVAHNGDSFDVKKFNARALLNGLGPLPNPIQEDTLKDLRSKFKLTSNRLDDVGAMTGKHRKMETPKGMWEAATDGDVQAIKTMVKYNKKDIPPLADVYNLISPWTKAKLNMNHFQPGDCCPKCKSKDYIKNGFRYTPTGKHQRYQCRSCGYHILGEKVNKKKKGMKITLK